MIKLSVENLHLTYGDNQILKGVSLNLSRGEVVSLLGPSGSGKTTLLRAVAGLESPHSGKISVDGQSVFDGESKIEIPAERRNLGLVFQSYALWPHRSVFDNVAYGLKLRSFSCDDIELKVVAALENLGLLHLRKRFPHQLSGGQQQRVAIARALVYNPPVILLDEPLSNLDAKMREEARAWLRELILDLQLSALVVTHDQNEAMAMSDRILLLNEGKIEQQGTPQKMYEQPHSLFAAEFMGANNRIEGTVSECQNSEALIEGDGWQLWGQICGSKTAADLPQSPEVKQKVNGMIRLERVRICDGEGENRLHLSLITSMFLGDRWEYLFHSEALRFRAYGNERLPTGKYWLEVPRQYFWIFL